MGAVLLGQEGTTEVELTVGSHGRTTNCAVVETSRYPALDDATCKVLSNRARFSPARDEQGRPTVGSFTQRVTWRVNGNTLPVKPWAIRLLVSLDEKGQPGYCAIEAGGALIERGSFGMECSYLSGAFTIPPELAKANLGRRVVVMFDQQFVPRTVNSINTPPDLKRFPLVSRSVLQFTIDPQGKVGACQQTRSEGSVKPVEEPCAALRGRRFNPAPGIVAPTNATATTAVYVRPN